MVTLLITALALLAIVGIGLYYWQKPAADYSENILPPSPDARGLFADDASSAVEETRQRELAASQRNESLISRAQSGEHDALQIAHESGDADLYDRVLNELVQSPHSEPELLALMAYVTQSELPVNTRLAQAAIASWKKSPDRSGTARALHFAALSDDADVYRAAVEDALGLWREQKLNNTAAVELQALFDGEFWILSSRSRSSGAGFVLKRTLENARRELEATARVKQ
jgi:hypothetical protein